MPYQELVDETYWKVCWAWIIPYPCRRTRTVTRWRYNFWTYGISCFGFIARYYGCEADIEYKFYKGCFGFYLNRYSTTGRHYYFEKRLEELGSCREGKSIPKGGMIPEGAGQSNQPLSSVGSSMMAVSATTILYAEYRIIQAYLQKVGSIPESELLNTALVLGFGGLLLISSLISFLKECQLGGMLSILIGILLIIIVLIFGIFTDYTLLAGLALNIIGAIINIRNSSHICE